MGVIAIGRAAGVNLLASMALLSFCAAREKKISRFLETSYRFVQLLPSRAARRPSARDGRQAALSGLIRSGRYDRSALTSRRGCPTKTPE
jgi:hypothetical protein